MTHIMETTVTCRRQSWWLLRLMARRHVRGHGAGTLRLGALDRVLAALASPVNFNLISFDLF